ncbi:hypothetical protein [Mucilaginibacter sp. OK098]|uniref:hypothetical protein n=1 Tax=Mucilaginibacter sp. OK098 TaxID=1855297 RepID=UPI00092383F9|nr:hypothetical protein [Mucilaginibacter sp. OK098]SHL95914.1 hypothetical protein SAMN05216524_101321 [Mucilaginibacter sp. OK098]
MISEIKNLNDVERFMKQLVAEGTNAHPDEDFNNYIHMESGEPAYTTDEAGLRNALMEQAFDVCDLAGVDVYNVMQEIFLIETGLDKYIPLPSQV